MSDRKSSVFSKVGFLLSVVTVLIALSAGWGTRSGFWNFRFGFTLLKWGAFGAIGSLALSAFGLIGALR